jgi:hypothetical protein
LIRTALKTRHRVTVQNPMHEIKRCLGRRTCYRVRG